MSQDKTAAPLGVVLFVAEGHTDHVAALRRAGYHVEVSPSALSALQRGQSLRPDALIVPLTLPDMDESDVAHRIGAAARAHALAVVILVAPDDAQASDGAAVTAGATFCNLPCSPAELVATVGKQLAARRLLRGQSPS